ncbi:fetal and adult testis-expressed transcript protein [Trichosurus vulpecula]|uniref:fetal and adult testis-expressed transcript protein n=1 Tax=Trichosurus vulpecula TaxID=9337 RepID=UPI00186B47A8|nr:fetal and adult testis-expressed transcript protein [Trichosurus vulpecula]
MLTSSWNVGPSRLWGDLNLTINQGVQVPSLLKVPGGFRTEEAKEMSDNLPLSFYFGIPDRFLQGDRGVGTKPLWINQARRSSPYVPSILVPDSYLATNNPFSAVCSSNRQGRLISPAKVLKDQACGGDTPMVAEDMMDPEEGSREGGLAVEDAGRMEIAALKKQLHKISGRLQALEARCSGWRQKEFLLYSALVSACVINTWLWMRR